MVEGAGRAAPNPVWKLPPRQTREPRIVSSDFDADDGGGPAGVKGIDVTRGECAPRTTCRGAWCDGEIGLGPSVGRVSILPAGEADQPTGAQEGQSPPHRQYQAFVLAGPGELDHCRNVLEGQPVCGQRGVSGCC